MSQEKKSITVKFLSWLHSRHWTSCSCLSQPSRICCKRLCVGGSCDGLLLSCRYQRHLGGQLFPPLGDRKRLARFPKLVNTVLQCSGDSWQLSSQDVAIAGLGWVAVTVSGLADLSVWAPPQAQLHTPPPPPFPLSLKHRVHDPQPPGHDVVCLGLRSYFISSACIYICILESRSSRCLYAAHNPCLMLKAAEILVVSVINSCNWMVCAF